jgi:hypothetical protein
MNYISTCKADARKRVVALLTTLCMLTLTVRLQQPDVALATCSRMQKIHRIEQNAQQLVRLSVRMYRFYKLTTPAPQAQASVN